MNRIPLAMLALAATGGGLPVGVRLIDDDPPVVRDRMPVAVRGGRGLGPAQLVRLSQKNARRRRR